MTDALVDIGFTLRCAGKIKLDRSARALALINSHVTADLAHEAENLGQPKARPLVTLRGEKGLEGLRGDLGRNAGAGIDYAHEGIVAGGQGRRSVVSGAIELS
jgi:hypothetical protein